MTLLRRLTVDQVPLEPVRTVAMTAPLTDLLDAVSETEHEDFVAVDGHGRYAGLALAGDVRTALLQKDAVPYLLVEDLARADVPTIRTSDDLAAVFDAFSTHDVPKLPVCLPGEPGRIIGLVSRRELMRVYHGALVGG